MRKIIAVSIENRGAGYRIIGYSAREKNRKKEWVIDTGNRVGKLAKEKVAIAESERQNGLKP